MFSTALTVGINHHQAALAFCNRLIAGETVVYFSELVVLEIAQFYRSLVARLDAETQRRHGLQRWDARPQVRQ